MKHPHPKSTKQIFVIVAALALFGGCGSVGPLSVPVDRTIRILSPQEGDTLYLFREVMVEWSGGKGVVTTVRPVNGYTHQFGDIPELSPGSFTTYGTGALIVCVLPDTGVVFDSTIHPYIHVTIIDL